MFYWEQIIIVICSILDTLYGRIAKSLGFYVHKYFVDCVKIV